MAGRRRDIWTEQVRDLATRLDALLGEVTDAVDALNSVLDSPPADGQAPGAMEVTAP